MRILCVPCVTKKSNAKDAEVAQRAAEKKRLITPLLLNAVDLRLSYSYIYGGIKHNQTKMKHLALLLILILSILPVRSQDCGQCSRPRVLLYDGYIWVDRPTDPQAIIAWYNLFWPSVSARAYLHANDPNKDCIRWMDGALVNADLLQGDTLKFGTEFLNLPPLTNLNSGEYMITGLVEHLWVNKYRYTLILGTAVSRKTVKTVEVDFQATPDSAFNAGEEAARQMTSLYSTIRSYEIEKRNSDVTVAISDYRSKGSPDVITLKPEKTLVNTNETIDIDVTMTDCDGVPLANRKVIFKDTTVVMNDRGYKLEGTTNGEIIPSVAYTDDSGKVTVRFKAGKNKGTAVINAWYPHFKPCGRPDVFQGAAMVQIENPPVRLWLLDARISQDHTMNRDTTMEYPFGAYIYKTTKSEKILTSSTAQVKAIIENIAENPENSFTYYSDIEPVALVVSGSGFMDDYSTNIELLGGQLMSANIRSDNVAGYASPGADIEIDYSDEYKYFAVGAGINGVGSYHGRMFFTEWSDYGGDYDSYGIGCSGGGYPENGCHISYADSTYHASWNRDTIMYNSTFDGTEITHETGSLEASLKPYHANSLSGTERDMLFPRASSLNQNYPNPFSSSTVITFQLDRLQHAVLTITDLMGNTLAILSNDTLPQGTYSLSWNAANLPQGIYFCRLQAGSDLITKKMVLLK